ncbi:MAG: efflux RND transporter periplasmic adaptor subunit, partial [Sphingomonadales bacterium]
MSEIIAIRRSRLAAYAVAGALAAAVAGYGIAQLTANEAEPSAASNRKILYWYDPMIPAERHDGPGLSSMGMKLIPKYADEEGSAAPGVAIDAAGIQRLGTRLATVERGILPQGITATGTIDFDERQVAVVQSRSAAFVQRVYARAPGDVVGAGAPLADVLVPEWAGARTEYDAVRRTGDPALERAARQRMALLGMDGRGGGYATIRTPIGGVIKTLGVRQGMTLAAGQTLAEVNGLGSVWLNAAVPEALAGQVRPGQSATATLAAFPGESFAGRVAAILP